MPCIFHRKCHKTEIEIFLLTFNKKKINQADIFSDSRLPFVSKQSALTGKGDFYYCTINFI